MPLLNIYVAEIYFLKRGRETLGVGRGEWDRGEGARGRVRRKGLTAQISEFIAISLHWLFVSTTRVKPLSKIRASYQGWKSACCIDIKFIPRSDSLQSGESLDDLIIMERVLIIEDQAVY